MTTPLEIAYDPPGPVSEAFFYSNAFLSGLKGPIGSGKSTACCFRPWRHLAESEPDRHGLRRARWAVVRNCYDEKTEILTERRGFQLFRDLLASDRVATLQGDNIVYVKPDRVAVSDYDGEMIGFEGEGVDFLVTPDHELWVSKKRTRAQNYGAYERVKAADAFGSTKYRVRRDAVWRAGSENPDLFEWLGFWFAEGSAGRYGRHKRLNVTQVKALGIAYARDLFNRAGIKFGESKRSDVGVTFNVSLGRDCLFEKMLYRRLLSCGSARTKHLPGWIKHAASGDLAAFLKGYAEGDGHRRKEGTLTLYTSSARLADDLQEVALKTGQAANISTRNRVGKGGKIKPTVAEHTVTIVGPTKLRPKLVKQVGRYRGWYKQPYKGKVYCAEMADPVVFVRRNGKAFWCIRTYPELKTTTIKTWHQWFPSSMGRWQDTGPPTHHILTGEVDMEVMFLALDRPDDVKKLLSLELTGAWVNEAREVPKAVIDGLTGRVGRFPPKRDGGNRWSGVIMDTNPPDTDHWWYLLAEKVPGETLDSLRKAEANLRAAGVLDAKQALFEFFAQPGGDSPQAENIENLPAGYYELASAGKTEDWIKVYVRGDYGYVTDGKPVYPEFRDNMHVRDVSYDSRMGLWIGIDFGLTPAAVIGQRTALGRWHWIDELVCEDMGAKRFGEQLRKKLDRDYADATIEGIFGDPSGDNRAQTDEKTPFDIIRVEGIQARPAPSNDPILRREAVVSMLTQLIDGVPGLLISPRCDVTRKGMAGGYQYRRMQITGTESYHDKPAKNRFSHPCEAAQYMMLGAGEGRAIVRQKRPRGWRLPQFAEGLD